MEGFAPILANLPVAEPFLVAVALGGVIVALALLEDRRLRQKLSAKIVVGLALAVSVYCMVALVSIIAFGTR